MSRLPFELLLALRYLRPKRTFVSVITLISVLGVLLGVAVLIVVISVMSGFGHDLREMILGFNPHLKVYRREQTMPDYAKVLSLVTQHPEVRGASPFVLGPVLMETQPETGQPREATPMVRGVDPKTEGAISPLTNSIVQGAFDLAGRGLLVGTELAAELRLNVGDRVAIYSARDLRKVKEAYKQGREISILPEDYEVRGIFDVGFYEYNAALVITSLEKAQELYALDEGDTVHGLIVMLRDPDQAPRVRVELERTLGPDYGLTIWTEENSTLLGAVNVEKNVMFFILIFIMIVAALCILSAQIVFVVQKTREIGMLKALGATRLQIGSLFLSQSIIIGLSGVALGYGLGMLALAYRNEFLRFLRSATGFELFPAKIYHFSELPALIVGPDIAIICVVSFLICLLGGVLPAWRAGRLQPVEALRYE